MRAKYVSVPFLIALSFILAGCGFKSGTQENQDNRIVAKIDDYELTVSDFKEEAAVLYSNRYPLDNPDVAKKELLEDLIRKKILIQEAQKQNFDKDKAFMKEIERYWEQALLKLLFKKKAEELSREINVDKKEVRDEKIQEALEAWIEGLRGRATVQINEENLKEVNLKR